MTEPHICQGMITLETAPGQTTVLNKIDADTLIEHLSKELSGILQIEVECALALAAATYPSEQIMQPGFPIHQHLQQYASAAFQGERNQAQMLAIGGQAGQMPRGLQPAPQISALCHIPYLFFTEDRACAERFESQLMHKGMISPPTHQVLYKSLQTPITHANHMTNLDLVALLHNHYEQLGLGEVWHIIETALVDQSPKLAVETGTHNHFFLVDHLVFTPQFAWPEFQKHHPETTPETFVAWLLSQRQAMTALSTHGLELKPFQVAQWPPDHQNICLGQFERHLITTDYWSGVETLPQIAAQPVCNYWTDPQAGVVAIQTIVAGERTSHWHHPLRPQGIQSIETHHRIAGAQINHLPFTQNQATSTIQ